MAIMNTKLWIVKLEVQQKVIIFIIIATKGDYYY